MNRIKGGAVALAILLSLCACTGTAKQPGDSSSNEQPAVSTQQIPTETLEKMPLHQGQWVELSEGKKIYQGSGSFFDTFDTVVDLTFYTKDEETFKRLFALAHEEFLRLHKLFDNYHEYPDVPSLMQINRLAVQAPIPVDPDLFHLLQLALSNYEDCLGKVNIALGPVLSLWHDAREAAGVESGPSQTSQDPSSTAPASGKAQLPDPEALQEANRHTDIHKVVLNERDQTVYLADPDMALDLGAIAKGYATELVARKLMEKGLESGLISAGGNVRTVGRHPAGRDWRIGIENPKTGSRDQAIASLPVPANASVVTSGDYQRYFVVDGKRYNHIIDPKTLKPAVQYASTSILTVDSGLADLLSTAFFIANPQEAQQIYQNYQKKGIPIEVVWIDFQNKLSSTAGLKNQLHLQGE